jgi:hypothetical protein
MDGFSDWQPELFAPRGLRQTASSMPARDEQNFHALRKNLATGALDRKSEEATLAELPSKCC